MVEKPIFEKLISSEFIYKYFDKFNTLEITEKFVKKFCSKIKRAEFDGNVPSWLECVVTIYGNAKAGNESAIAYDQVIEAIDKHHSGLLRGAK